MNLGRLVIEHPVLWSEERRRIEEKRIADDSLKLARTRRERQRRTSLIEEQEVGTGPLLIPFHFIGWEWERG